jgi:hypothetical protein
MRKKFNWRAFNSLYIVYSFIILSLSGFVLFIAPPGRIANWTNLTIMGFTKHEWQAIHIIFTFLFFIAIVFHIYFNWKPILFYFRKKRNQKTKIKFEFYTVTLIVFLIFFVTYLDLPPANGFIDLGESLSNSWEEKTNSAPISHAELLTINELAQQIKKSPEQIFSSLKNSGITVESKDISIKTIAQNNNISPDKLYKIIRPEIVQNHRQGNLKTGRGLGRKTLNQIATESNISINILLQRLKQKGIVAHPESTVKDIADSQNIYPYVLLEQLEITHAQVQ